MNCIHELFFEQALLHPQKIAIVLNQQSLTYNEVLHCVKLLADYLIQNHNVKVGDIICQYLERSIEMVLGILAIISCGCSYCPLSIDDPAPRTHSLIEETKAECVLVHSLTKMKLNDLRHVSLVNCEQIIVAKYITKVPRTWPAWTVKVTDENIAYVIFTSGSTGQPKAVQIRHRNFVSFINAVHHEDIMNKNDVVVQTASCIWDPHVQEILGSMLFGCELVMLQQHGNRNVDYLMSVIYKNQATFLTVVPSLLIMFAEYFQIADKLDYMKTIRVLRCGGAGVFPGYFNNESNEKCLLQLPDISDDKCYVTGDLGKIDSNGELYFVGRVDFQIKLRGQRIEIGEIERIILNVSSNVTNCVVIKYQQQPEDQEHLIAYVQSSSSSSNNEMIIIEELKHYCQQYLPLYMIPTWFIVLEQLPLNTNGKVNRKQLPKPDFSHLTQQQANDHHVDEPNGEMEIEIHALWCRLLSIDTLSMKSNFFSMGGNSLLLMKLYNYYLSTFSLNQQIINIAMLFKQSTIVEHVQLLKNALLKTVNDTFVVQQQQWKPLN
ncbi:unnamed protein product, partial [Didymodactylos carnosus]